MGFNYINIIMNIEIVNQIRCFTIVKTFIAEEKFMFKFALTFCDAFSFSSIIYMHRLSTNQLTIFSFPAE